MRLTTMHISKKPSLNMKKIPPTWLELTKSQQYSGPLHIGKHQNQKTKSSSKSSPEIISVKTKETITWNDPRNLPESQDHLECDENLTPEDRNTVENSILHVSRVISWNTNILSRPNGMDLSSVSTNTSLKWKDFTSKIEPGSCLILIFRRSTVHLA